MKKITIGLFNDSFFPMTDGVGVVVDNYARRLSKKCNVVVFVPHYQNIDDSKFPYKIVRCRSIKVPFLDYSLPLPLLDFRFRREVKKSKLDLIHVHSPFSIGKYGVRFAERHHIPVLATMHSQYQQDFSRAVQSKRLVQSLTKGIVRVFNRCNRCFAVNSGMSDLYYYDYGVREKPGVLSNATEMVLVDDISKSRKKINSLWNLKEEDKVFLFVGRINKLKNIYFIIDSLSLLKKKKVSYSFKMLFVGEGQDFSSLEDYIKRKDMEDVVLLCGKVDDRNLLRDYYARSDLLLFPSLYDASSIVQIEAASQKTPGVFLKGSMTASDIIDGKNGFLASNEEDFAEAIHQAMIDSELYEKVSEGAYQDVYKTWDDVLEIVFQIYLDTIGG